jgi:general secretion pathway protein K
MKITLAPKNRGIAVIVALVAVTVLTLLAGTFAYSMKIEAQLAHNSNNEEEMLWMGRGGVELARWVLAMEGRQPFDSLNQIWAGGPGAGPETNSVLNGLSLDNYPLGDGTVSIKIIDLERRVNVNAANADWLRWILTQQGVDAGSISTVVDSIQDWIDPDDSTSPAGAESDYYQGQNPPYYAKNALIDDLSELLMIKGITRGMYLGGAETNSDAGVFQHHKLGLGHRPGEEPNYAFGLRDVLTPFSSGKINIYTADATVISLIPNIDNTSVQNIIKFRAGPDGTEGTDDDTPFVNIGQAAAAGVSPETAQLMNQFCVTKSTTFEVHVTARIGESHREFVAVLFRNGPNVDTMQFYWTYVPTVTMTTVQPLQ